jgi:hypothetical protein
VRFGAHRSLASGYPLHHLHGISRAPLVRSLMPFGGSAAIPLALRFAQLKIKN